MGCGASREAATEASAALGQRNPKRQGGGHAHEQFSAIHSSRRSYEGIPLQEMCTDAENALDGQVRAAKANRQASNARLRAARGVEGLQARGLLMAIFSTAPEVFEEFLRDSPEYVNQVTFTAMPSNAMTGGVMLSMASEIQGTVEAATGVVPNTALLGEPLENLLRLKAIWGRSLLGVTLRLSAHPGLDSDIALVQPLLGAAAMLRVFNWGAEVDPVFEVLIKAGASPNLRNSLGMTPLLLVSMSLMSELQPGGGGAMDGMAARVGTAIDTARLLIDAGADVGARMVGFGPRWRALPERDQDAALSYSLRIASAFMHLERYTAREAFELMRAELKDALHSGDPAVAQRVDEFGALLRPPPPAQQQGAADGSGGGGGGGEVATASAAPLLHLDRTWPWQQAMSNIAWAVSQLAMVRGAAQRRALLLQLQEQAPFALPPMSVVSVQQLRKLGHIPRFALDGSAQDLRSAFRPLDLGALGERACVVFVSHRWLGNGCPDDDKGTKLKQVFAIAEGIAAKRGVSVDDVSLWLDYSVVNQANPMPGVQALPIYIACCDEFVYVFHEAYWQRAWCLTEQYMQFKLGSSDAEQKYCLDPQTLVLRSESSREKPPDPTFGKLSVEADRIALALMTSLLPYS